MLVDAPLSARPSRNRHSVRLCISTLSAADIDGVVQDLALCAEVVQTYTVDADKYGDVISGLTDIQVLRSCILAFYYPSSIVYIKPQKPFRKCTA